MGMEEAGLIATYHHTQHTHEAQHIHNNTQHTDTPNTPHHITRNTHENTQNTHTNCSQSHPKAKAPNYSECQFVFDLVMFALGL